MSGRILIVEDHAPMAKALKDILELMCGNTTIASKGQTALKLLGRSSYDLVVLDLCLDQPDFNLVAKKFLGDLRAVAPRIPIVGITHKQLLDEEAFWLSKMGVVEFVRKQSLDVDRLRALVRKTLGLPKRPFPLVYAGSEALEESKGKRTPIETRALQVLIEHPDWPKTEIAKQIGCHPKSLSPKRCPKLDKAIRAHRQGSPPHRGWKSKDGHIEAVDGAEG